MIRLADINYYAAFLLTATLLSAGIYFATVIYCWMTNEYEKVKQAILLLVHITTNFNFIFAQDNIDAGVCFFAVISPIMIPFMLLFFYLNWVGIQFFTNN